MDTVMLDKVVANQPPNVIDWDHIFYVMTVDLNAQITLAETKAQLVMGGCAIMLAAIGLDQGTARQFLLSGGASWLERASFVFLLLTFCALTAAVFYALATARPNLSHPPTRVNNLLFFRHITRMDAATYHQNLLDMSVEEMKTYISAQLYAKSQVVEAKFRTIHHSLNLVFVAMLFWGLSRLLLAFAR